MKKLQIFQRHPKTGKRVISIGNLSKIAALFAGFISLIWFLVRVIPKPSRATYPCMKATMPLASSFIAFLVVQISSVWLFRKGFRFVKMKIFSIAMILFMSGMILYFVGSAIRPAILRANQSGTLFTDPLGPNSPIGEAKGIYPGRVVWVFDPDATDKTCDPDHIGDGYFLDVNCNQTVVNSMVSNAIQTLTGTTTDAAAWDSIFMYFNNNHGKGKVGYASGEKIFIKINTVHAFYSNFNDGQISDDDYGNVETSPQVVLAMLDQLINHAGVAQADISVGDPITCMYDNYYTKWHTAFPNVHYIAKYARTGREEVSYANTQTIYYSDSGTVLGSPADDIVGNIATANYLLNIPALKGHRWAGITGFAKNHFGSHTGTGSSHLHYGLHRTSESDPLRDNYQMYRVFVDLMGNRYLGGNTLLYLEDALWCTSEEHTPPAKFQSAPFNNDWTSSILASLDPVAIESVGLSILQKEFKTENLNSDPPRYTFVQWNAVDDYLHQAASSTYWPTAITYKTGEGTTLIGSLGTHEHWNNETDMQFSRNLGTGDGIELVKKWQGIVSINDVSFVEYPMIIHPNPCKGQTVLSLYMDQDAEVIIEIFNTSGSKIMTQKPGMISEGKHDISLDVNTLNTGVYYCVLRTAGSSNPITSNKLIVR